jgi:Flp pilus assembly protein TadD
MCVQRCLRALFTSLWSLELCPLNKRLRRRLMPTKATELAQAGNLREAEVELRSAVGLAPGKASYLASLGTVLAIQRKFEESTIVFKQALKTVPSDATTRRAPM